MTTTLGPLAQAVEGAPVVTLTTFGAILGGITGAALGLGGAALARADERTLWTVGLGIGALGAVLGGAKGYSDGQSLAAWLAENAPSTPGGTTPTPSPSGSPPSVSGTTINLGPGTLDVVSNAGMTYEVALPAGATWQKALSGDQNSSIGSAPSSGGNPAGFTYLGSGSMLTATWFDSNGATQQTGIVLTG